MPAAAQLAALAKAGAARQKLAAEDDTIMQLMTAFTASRERGEDTTALAGQIRAAMGDRDKIVAALLSIRQQILTSADALGAGVLAAALPVLLLPVRLETRYEQNLLRIRIYPDDIHRDSYEPGLTPAEVTAAKVYFKALDVARDRPPWLAAWRDLVAKVGWSRALHIATLTPPAGTRPGPWSRPVIARIMPDRFVAYVWTEGASQPIRELAANLVREPLALGPDPLVTDTELMGESARWLHDYAKAVDAGMAIDVPLGATGLTVDRVVVLGVRASVDAQAQATELEALLTAHHLTGGLALLPPGSPTNALDGMRPQYTSRPDPEDLYNRELSYSITGATRHRRDPAYIVPLPGGVGQRIDRFSASFALAEGLGIHAETLGYSDGAGDGTIMAESAARELLRSIFIDGAARAVAPGVSRNTIEDVFNHLTSVTSALGPYGTLLIGTQPYGVFPILLGDRALRDAFTAGLYQMLDGLRSRVFAPAEARVPRVGNAAPGDPEAQLVSLLRDEGIARQLRVRAVLSSTLADRTAAAMGTGRTHFNQQRNHVMRLLASLGLPQSAQSSVARMLCLSEAGLVTRPLIAADNAAGSETPAVYLGWLRTLPLMDIFEENYPAAKPQGVLFDLARAALLFAADADARRTLVHDGHVSPARFDNPADSLGSLKGRLEAPAPLDPVEPLYGRLRYPGVPEAVELVRLDNALAQLMEQTPAALETLVGGTLGLLSHRLDAWYTSFATTRLRSLRENPPAGIPKSNGVGLGMGAGAYGWLGRIPRRNAGSSSGYVHAPSTQHAVAAGVLLSVDTAHRAAGHGAAFAVDLSSSRARAALELLDGVREGQPLEALIGYRIERSLVEAGGTAPALIATLRAIAPLIANRLTPGPAPAEAVAAANVVDGVALLRLANANGTQTADVSHLPQIAATANAFQTAALNAALRAADDSLDAVGDLVLAESVFHLVGGQPGKAGAAVDAIAGTAIPPPEAEVVATPIRGTGTTHRIFIALDSVSANTTWSATPRAVAEPLVEAWVAAMLPPPSAVRLRGTFRDTDGEVVDTVDVTLDDLLTDAEDAGRDELGVGALDVVLGSFDVRLVPLMELGKPTGDDINLQLLLERDETFSAADVSIPELKIAAGHLRALLGVTRALQIDDVPFAATVNTVEIEARVTTAIAAATDVRDNLATANTDSDRVQYLLAANQFGVPLLLDMGHLAQQVIDAKGQLDARLAAAGDATKPSVDRLIALFGSTMPIVPHLTLAGQDMSNAFGEAIGAAAGKVRSFIERAARVRSRIALLRAVLGNCDAIGAGNYDMHVAQRPIAAGEQWIGLPGPIAGGRTSLVALTGAALPGAQRVSAGLFVDDWVETIPYPHADTSVAFHLPAPSAAAPNALLLCVPDISREAWTEADLLANVLEAGDLSRLRAVSPDALGTAAQILPAMLADDMAFGASIAVDLTEPPRTTP